MQSYSKLGHSLENLDLFDVSTMQINARIVLCGKTDNGKSSKTKCIMEHYNTLIPKGCVFSGSLSNGDYDYMPQAYLFDGLQLDVVDRIWNYQDQRIMEKEFDDSIQTPAWIVIDDIGKAKERNSPKFEMLFSRGRNKELTLLYIVQYYIFVPAECRTNVDYIIITGLNSTKEVKLLQENYEPDMSWQEFNHLVQENTKNFSALVIYNNYKGKDKRKRYFRFHIPDDRFVPNPRRPGKLMYRDFEFGSAKYRNFSAVHYYNWEREAKKQAIRERMREKRRIEQLEERKKRNLMLGNGHARLVDDDDDDDDDDDYALNSSRFSAYPTSSALSQLHI
jgi:hypothetical protein